MIFAAAEFKRNADFCGLRPHSRCSDKTTGGRMRIGALLALALLPSVAMAADSREPLDYLTAAPGSAFCRSYGSLSDAKAALRAGDAAWFAETRCRQMGIGDRLTVVEGYWSSQRDDLVWRVRAQDAVINETGYMLSSDAWTWGRVRQVRSKDEARRTIEAATKASWRLRNKRVPIFFSPATEGASNGWVLIGPASHHWIRMTCYDLNFADPAITCDAVAQPNLSR